MRTAILLAIFASLNASAAQERIVLSDASGGDCALNYLIYDTIYDKRRKNGGLENAVPFVNDVCDMQSRVRLGLNGEVIELLHKSGTVRNRPRGMRLSFSNEKTSIRLHVKERLHEEKDAEFACTRSWYRVDVTIEHLGARRVVKGSVDWGDCP